MCAETIETPQTPVPLDDIIAFAKSLTQYAFAQLDYFDDDMRPFAVLVGPLMDATAFAQLYAQSVDAYPFELLAIPALAADGALVVALPPVKGDLPNARVASAWLPALLSAQQAAVCVIVQPVWHPSHLPAPGTMRRGELLHIAAYDEYGESVGFADFDRDFGGLELGAWVEPTQVSHRGLWPNAIHAAMANYDTPAGHWPHEFETPFGFEHSGDPMKFLADSLIKARVFPLGGNRYAAVALHRDDEYEPSYPYLLDAGENIFDLTIDEYSAVLNTLLHPQG